MQRFFTKTGWEWLVFVRHVWARAQEARIGLIAGGAAFSGLLSLFPGLGAVIALVSLMADPAVVMSELDLLRGFLPDDIYALLADRLAALLAAGQGGLSLATALSFLLALWSARAGVAALLEGIQAINKTAPGRSVLWMLHALLLTLVLLLLVVTALALVVVLPLGLSAVDLLWPGQISGAGALVLIGRAVAFCAVLIALGLLYRYGAGPGGALLPWLTPGAVLVAISWVGASYGLAQYLRAFSRFNEVYGSIGAVVALQLWLYVSAYLCLLGAALNAEWFARAKAAR